MPRYFNTTGPCDAKRHYMLPPEARIPDLEPYLQQDLYFVVHAARQTGKTTAMRSFAARMREQGKAALWATLEESQGVEEVEKAEPLWLRMLWDASQLLPGDQRAPSPEPFLQEEAGNRLRRYLQAWSARLTVPLVLLLDEADTISGPAMVSFLRQLRAGFADRGIGKFPTSVALIGMRDLRDYLTRSKDGVPVNPGSPFNIKKSSLTLRNFTLEEIGTLYAQHTADTGQLFTPAAVARAFYWTRGQPFLVNALADLCVLELANETITEDHINRAKEQLILSRTTHLDALGQRLNEERVARIVQAVLVGDIPDQISYRSDDFQYVQDLGLIVHGKDGAEAANPLYREVLARELSYDRQLSFFRPRFRWQHPDGRLDFPALLDAFFEWWRENEEAILARGVKEYPEAFPHLCLMAFFQRVLNGGGEVFREFAAGRGALDLMIVFAGQRFVVEVKRVFESGPAAEKVKKAGIQQLAEYLESVNEPEGWLLIFNQRPAARAAGWEQRLWAEEVEESGKHLHLRGG
jgi:hypothetical protein